MLMPGRSYNSAGYRYGFNGKEKDDEAKGAGAQYDYGFRIYDPRLGRFLSVDPLTMSYPWYTPYQFAGNKPIWAIDLDGLEEFYVTHWTSEGTHYSKIQVTIANKGKDDAPYERGAYTDEAHRVQYTDRSTGKVDYKANLQPHEMAAVQGAFKKAADGVGYVPAGSYEITATSPAPPERKKIEPTTTAHPPTTTTPPAASTPTSSPPAPGGFLLGNATTATPLSGYAEANKNVANWLMDNPDFNISITTGAGIPNGEGLSDDITWTDFKSKTYQDRTNEFIAKWKTDITKASGGKVSADRINVTIGDPNSKGYSIKADPKKK